MKKSAKRKPIGKKPRIAPNEEQISSNEEEQEQGPKQAVQQSLQALKKRLTSQAIQSYSSEKDDFFLAAATEDNNPQALGQLQECIQYRGHTKCITGIQLTATLMYSCSKDKSIIRWDRQTQKKEFVSRGMQGHTSDILCLALHSNENVLATAGQDMQIKLWDVRMGGLVQTLPAHKNHINCLKFGVHSHNLCSGSSDLTLKMWDWAQRGLIETFYEHNAQVLDLDAMNGSDFLSSGNDHQAIVWKTEKETKIGYKGHEYAIDRARFLTHQKFVTASQDGQLNLFWAKKSKPVAKVDAHASGWIGAMDALKQSNLVATGAIDQCVRIWTIDSAFKGATLTKEIPTKGIITDIKLKKDYIAFTECDQHRLGRWVTTKCRNKIKVYRIKG